MSFFSRIFLWSENLFNAVLSLSNKRADFYFLLCCFCFSAFQILLVLFSPLALAADEAQYWDWSRSLDFSYYSKGPGVALLIALASEIFGVSEFAVRAPALLSSFGLSLAIYLCVRKLYSPQIALLAFILARTTVFYFVLGVVMTTDPPTMLFWFLSLYFAVSALRFDKPFYWLHSGLAVGFTLLSKYTVVVLFPVYFFFLLSTSEKRHHLKSQWLWIGALTAGLFLLPMLIWNLQNDWVNFLHNANHLAGKKEFAIRPRYFFELVGGQICFIGPVAFFGLIYSIKLAWRKWCTGDHISGQLLVAGGSLIIICLAVSLTKRVYANWPAPAYLAFFLLFAHLMLEETYRNKIRRWFFVGVFCNLFLSLFISGLFLGETYALPAKVLTTKKLAGWKELANEVDNFRKLEDKNIIVSEYEIAAELGFYLKDHPRVRCANFGGRRMNQYDIWQKEDLPSGSSAIAVVKADSDVDALKKHYDKIGQVKEFKSIYAGDEIQRYLILRVEGYRGGLFRSPLTH